MDTAETAARLRQEVEELKRQLEAQRGTPDASAAGQIWRPSGLTITVLFLMATALIAGAFVAGYVPLRKRNAIIRSEAAEQEQALPRMAVIRVERSSRQSELELPGSIQAVTEAPLLARAEGYILRRMVDIGDRVTAGQLLAEIAAPEIDQQIRQAQAALQQVRAALDQALANYEQGKSNMELARITAERWARLVARGAVSKQENDQYQAQYQAQSANVQALEKAVAAQRSNIAAAEANVARLDELQAYRMVRAPFEGVITLRNVDVGALVNAGSTLLFRIAQTGTLRTYVNVPQSNSTFVKLGQPAQLSVSNLPGRHFNGTVIRTANALDPATRTLLVEIQVPNGDGALLPGMYAQVDLGSARGNPPLLIPGDALIIRADGTQVAMVRPDHTVHLQMIEVGRDYGDRLEVVGGLREGDMIIPNPTESAREGVKVDPIP
ncbi:MAG: efflux RND transporter periplasmic adaptor subunit [Terriglobia bacterium]|nr:MAG: efflux RND transporter periplasmic adaptor subunit [Terriglobia bacterium]